MHHSRRATVRDLRHDFARVESALAKGEGIEIVKRNKVIAHLVPVKNTPPAPDFAGRLKAIWGDKVFEVSGAALIALERDRY